MECHRDPGLGMMYSIVRSEALLAQRMAALAHQVSLMTFKVTLDELPLSKPLAECHHEHRQHHHSHFQIPTRSHALSLTA